MDDWQKRTGQHEPSEPLHLMVQQFMATPVRWLHQKPLRDQHVKASHPQYAEVMANDLGEALAERIAHSKQHWLPQSPHPLTQQEIERLDRLQQTDMHYFPPGLTLLPPGPTETYGDLLKMMTFLRKAKSARRDKWLTILDQVKGILGERMPPVMDDVAGQARHDESIGEKLKALGDALEQLALPPGAADQTTLAASARLVSTQSIAILEEASKRYKGLYDHRKQRLMGQINRALMHLPDDEREAAVFRMKQFLEGLDDHHSMVDSRAPDGSIRIEADMKDALNAFKIGGLIDDAQFKTGLESMRWFRAVGETIEDMQKEILPLIDSLRGQGRNATQG